MCTYLGSQMNRLRLVFAALLTLVLVAIAAPTFATTANQASEPSNVSGESKYDAHMPSAATIAAQERLDKLADIIQATDRDDQVATMKVDQDSLTLTIYLKGPVSRSMDEAVKTADQDIKVKIEPARFSMKDMQAAIKRTQDAIAAGKADMYAAIMPNTDGSGLTVRAPQTMVLARTAPSLGSDYKEASGIPVTVEVGEKAVPTSRVNDGDPWSGGGVMMRSGTICSTAFTILRTDGYGRVLSAAHCDPYGNAAWTDGAGQAFTNGGGSVSTDRVPYDTMIIDPIGGTVGKIYGGPFDATSSHLRYKLSVAGDGGSHINDYICTSGANSGEHCGIRVTQLGISWPCGINSAPPPAEQCGGHTGRNPSVNTAATVAGDSGGPVYSTQSDGRVSARGVIWGGTTSTVCPPTRYATTVCLRDLYYPAIRPIIDYWNAAGIETSP